jgi:hypothetical protein
VNEFLDDDGFTDARAAEKSDFTALDERCEQVARLSL